MNKVSHLYALMARLAQGEELYARNERLQEEFGVDERTIRRYLEEIHTHYNEMIIVERKAKEYGSRRVNVYRVVDREKDVGDVLRFFLEHDNDLTWIVQMLHDQDPTLLDNAGEAREALEDALRKDADTFVFNSRPFEQMETAREKQIFASLKQAVQRHEYRNISYRYDKQEEFVDVKCLKIIFTQNNWYLAGETAKGNLKWFRLRFIEEVSYSDKNTYQSSTLHKYAAFFARFENAMTLHGTPAMTAKILASRKIARYFEQDMKPFFRSQKFVKKYEDGSIEFSVEYTQPLEILPFVKQWSPDLKILEPTTLVKAYIKDLRKALEEHGQ